MTADLVWEDRERLADLILPLVCQQTFPKYVKCLSHNLTTYIVEALKLTLMQYK